MSNTFYSEAGKGSFSRKRDVSKEEYENNWDRIFGKKEKLEVFNSTKVENFKASIALDSGCSTSPEEPSQEEVPVGEQ